MAREKCNEIAQFVVPWAGKTLLFCERHTREISALGGAMGTPLEARPINTTDECEQIEEAEK